MSLADEIPAVPEAWPDAVITRALILLFAISVGVIVTNLFAAQTLVGLIGLDLGLAVAGNGLIAMASLLGYATGLFLLAPLADLLENRLLILRLLIGAVVCASASALAPNAASLLVLLFVLGAACSAIQILVPIAASMAPIEQRGRVIGDVMSGLMVGILLARPLASLLAGSFGWRSFYGASALAMAVLTLVLALRLPRRQPAAHNSYRGLIASLWHLLRSEPVLRRRASTASLCLAAFSLFWTAVALRLAQQPFSLDQRGIALFALAGAGGAIVSPLAGRAGDRGWTRPVTVAFHLVMIAAFALAGWAGMASHVPTFVLLCLMAASAIFLDIGVIGDQTLGRRAINLLQPEARGRLNGLFVGLFFLGGAVGAALAGLAWVNGGWLMICIIGALFGFAALVVDCFGKEA